MAHHKKYQDLKITLTTGRMTIEPTVTEGPEWRGLVKQVRRWVREVDANTAESWFVKVYIPGAVVVPPEERGLTEGMVFTRYGRLFWDEAYQIRSFLNLLLEEKKTHFMNMGVHE